MPLAGVESASTDPAAGIIQNAGAFSPFGNRVNWQVEIGYFWL